MANFNLSVIAKAIVKNVENSKCRFDEDFILSVEEEMGDSTLVGEVEVAYESYFEEDVNYGEVNCKVEDITDLYLQYEDSEYYFTNEEVAEILRLCA